jgi:hypothetical protein
VKTITQKPVRYLRARCGVRYWEDAKVNGVADTEGNLIPGRVGTSWCPLIDLETGKIENWTPGTTADIHYKVADDGDYVLLDADRNVVKEIEGYVPSIMSPKESGHGDYVIMDIDGDGVIQNWEVDLDEFEVDDDE